MKPSSSLGKHWNASNLSLPNTDSDTESFQSNLLTFENETQVHGKVSNILSLSQDDSQDVCDRFVDETDLNTRAQSFPFSNISRWSVDDLLFVSILAQKTENYDDMKICMRQIAFSKNVLTNEEQNLLVLAYKNVVGKRRVVSLLE